MRNATIGLFVLMSVAVLTGCATTTDAVLSPDFASRNVKSVAVVLVVGTLDGEVARDQIADLFSMEFMRKGYRGVERQQAVAVLKEQEGRLPSSSYDDQAVFIGRLLGVDSVIVVNIPKFGERMDLTAKLLAVNDGTQLWIASGSGTTGKTAATIVGAATGAAIGAQFGGGTDEHILGGVVGGVVGGVAGNALAPSKVTKLKKIIGKMCATLPDA